MERITGFVPNISDRDFGVPKYRTADIDPLSVSGLSVLIEDIQLKILELFPQIGYLGYYQLLASRLPGRVPVIINDEALREATQGDRQTGLQVLLGLNIKTILTSIEPFFGEDPVENDEIVQDAVVYVLENIVQKSSAVSIPQYIYRIAQKGASEHKVVRDVENIGLFPAISWVVDQKTDVVYPFEDPTVHELSREILLPRIMRDCLDRLSRRERTVLELYYFADPPKTRKDIAEMFGVSENYIHQVLGQSLTKLRHPSVSKLLKDYAADDADYTYPVRVGKRQDMYKYNMYKYKWRWSDGRLGWASIERIDEQPYYVNWREALFLVRDAGRRENVDLVRLIGSVNPDDYAYMRLKFLGLSPELSNKLKEQGVRFIGQLLSAANGYVELPSHDLSLELSKKMALFLNRVRFEKAT